MAGKRVSPVDRAAARNVPVDMAGVDPEMAKTLGDEVNRVTRQKMVYAPKSLATAGKETDTAPAKKLGLVDKIKRKMGIQY
jgi:hypothetical protein